MEIIPIEDASKWDSIVRSFPNHDVYYLSGYVKAFQLHGDGYPFLFYAQSLTNRAICVLMIRDLSSDSHFAPQIPSKEYYDAVTPYGYGGFIFETDPDDKFLEELKQMFIKHLKELGVISVFFRFHPVLNNAKWHHEILEVIDLGKTIAMDLTSPDIIWSNISSKNRNMIRKAEKNGIEIHHSKGLNLLLKEFFPIYNKTMDHDHAEEYYYFPGKFYESIDTDLANNYEVFYATFEGKIIAASIMIFSNQYLNYHLSGSLYEYRNLAPSNLLLYKAALWGYENGKCIFHLGGGVGSGEDNLYKFKAAFNRNSDYQFSIGKLIIDAEKYQYLVSLRGKEDNFNNQSKFFPLYRS